MDNGPPSTYADVLAAAEEMLRVTTEAISADGWSTPALMAVRDSMDVLIEEGEAWKGPTAWFRGTALAAEVSTDELPRACTIFDPRMTMALENPTVESVVQMAVLLGTGCYRVVGNVDLRLRDPDAMLNYLDFSGWYNLKNLAIRPYSSDFAKVPDAFTVTIPPGLRVVTINVAIPVALLDPSPTSHLEVLNLRYAPEIQLPPAPGMARLGVVSLSDVTIRDLEPFRSAQSLHTLTIRSAPRLNDIGALSTLPLRSLEMTGLQLLKNLRPLSGNTRLTLLTLGDLPSLSSLDAFASHPAIALLTLGRLPGVPEANIRTTVSSLPSLQGLTLNSLPHLKSLALQSNLHTLTLIDMPGINNVGFQYVRNLTELGNLLLFNTGVTDLAVLREMPESLVVFMGGKRLDRKEYK